MLRGVCGYDWKVASKKAKKCAKLPYLTLLSSSPTVKPTAKQKEAPGRSDQKNGTTKIKDVSKISSGKLQEMEWATAKPIAKQLENLPNRVVQEKKEATAKTTANQQENSQKRVVKSRKCRVCKAVYNSKEYIALSSKNGRKTSWVSCGFNAPKQCQYVLGPGLLSMCLLWTPKIPSRSTVMSTA